MFTTQLTGVILYNAQCFAVVKDLSDIPLPDVQEKPSLESILNEVNIRCVRLNTMCDGSDPQNSCLLPLLCLVTLVENFQL